MKPVELKAPKLILVEGRDEEEFLGALLREMDIGGVQGVNYEGKGNLTRVYLQTLMAAPGFAAVTHLVLTRDADRSKQSAMTSLRGTLRACGLPCPEHGKFIEKRYPIIGVYIFPGKVEKGMLEDLCLSTVSDRPIMECVDRYMSCLTELAQGKRIEFPRNPSKARAHAYLAGMPELVREVGVAAQRGYWDLDHAELGELRSFLASLR